MQYIGDTLDQIALIPLSKMPDDPVFFPPITTLPLVEGTFLSRPNRFSVHCGIEGRETKVFMPNPGRMGELLLPEVDLLLADHGHQAQRKTRYTVMAVRYRERIVFLHTHLNNLAARRLIEARAIPALKNCQVAGTEVTVGDHRFDFLLRDDEGDLYLEVKSCTLSANGIAMFPDAVTERGLRHLQSLACMNAEGRRGALLFLVHHGNASLFLPDYHTDYAFSTAFRDAENRLPVFAAALEWKGDLRYRVANQRVTIPWATIRGECVDSGHLLRVARRGSGYRVTLSSYQEGLSNNIRRSAGTIYPIRSSMDDSARILGVLAGLYGNVVKEPDGWFFESGCNPVPTRGFQNALLEFRMPRRLMEQAPPSFAFKTKRL